MSHRAIVFYFCYTESMKIPKFLATLLFLLSPLLLLVPHHAAHALCFDASNSTVNYTDDGYVANLMVESDIVALGVLNFVSDNPWPPTYTLTVEKHWKGDVKKGDTLTIRDGMLRGGPCGGRGTGAKNGQRYLLFLSGSKGSVLSVKSYQSAATDTDLPSQLQSKMQQIMSTLQITALSEQWALFGSGLSLVLALVLLFVWLRLKPKKL